MKTVFISFISLISIAAHAYSPASAERLDILASAAKSSVTDARTQRYIDSLTAPKPYEQRTSITSFECTNGRSTTADYTFTCTILFGEDDLTDNDGGFSSIFQIMIDGTVTKGKRKIEFTKSELWAG